MTNMFKRSLVALAIAGASTGAMAADVTPTVTTSASDQFMSTMESILSKDVKIVLNDEYSINDEIYLRFEGEAYLDNAPLSVDVAYGDQFTNGGSSGTDVNKGISLDYKGQLLDDAGNIVLIYRVSEIVGDDDGTTNDTTYGIELNFERLSFDAPTVIAQNGVMFDTFSRLNDELWPAVAEGENMFDHDVVTTPMISETQLFVMGDQFEIEVLEEFDGTLNVWDFRRSFLDTSLQPCTDNDVLSPSCYSFEDNVQVRVNNAEVPEIGGDFDYRVYVDQTADTQVLYKITSTNMFGWIDSLDPEGAEVVINSSLAPNNCTYNTHTPDQLWINCERVNQTLDFSMFLDGSSNSEQNPKQAGAFSVTAEVSWYNDDPLYPNSTQALEDGVVRDGSVTGMSTVDTEEAGEWKVNGSMTTIPYMPYSAQSEAGEATAIGQIIYVTNTTRDPGTDDPFVENDPNGIDDNGEGPTPEENDVNRLIWVEGIDENGVEFGPVELPVTADPGVTGIAGHIRNVLLDEGLLDNGNRIALTITVADYPTNIQIYSAYNVNGSDRGWVQNDTIRMDMDVLYGNEILD
ncbi:hypothetical protein [Pseudidiomarina salilacus]|uniref:hypothetical protein n=1 Tax=Pseudidiomarina salilacus TaxID=3384452 RepID=UPI003984F959